MKSQFKALICIAVILCLSILPKIGFCAWEFQDETGDAIVLTRTDQVKHEINKGIYCFYDAGVNKWITILDFSQSPYPLVSIPGYTLVWKPDSNYDF